MVVREPERECGSSKGRKLKDAPGYSYRAFVAKRMDAYEEIWREYDRRADMENRIAELRDDLGGGAILRAEMPSRGYSGGG